MGKTGSNRGRPVDWRRGDREEGGSGNAYWLTRESDNVGKNHI